MNGPGEKLVHPPGMSPEEQREAFQKGMEAENEALEKMPARFKKGEMLEEVVGEDLDPPDED